MVLSPAGIADLLSPALTGVRDEAKLGALGRDSPRLSPVAERWSHNQTV